MRFGFCCCCYRRWLATALSRRSDFTDLVAAKFAALLAGWLIALIPVLSTLVWWGLLGGHLDTRATVTLMLGHLLYALLIGAIAFLAAAVTEGGATAAILALAVTLGSWVLDFAALDRGVVSPRCGCRLGLRSGTSSKDRH